MLGARTVYTYDHVCHVRLALVRNVINQIEKDISQIASSAGIPRNVLEQRVAQLKSLPDTRMIFEWAGIVYMAPADATRTGLPNYSVDLIYSYGVLEHVPEQVIHDLADEAKRILKPGASACHTIGLGDHCANGRNGLSYVNFLKYSPRLWNLFMDNKISFHNRLREKQFLDLFRQHGAEVRILDHVIKDSDLQTLKTLRIHPCFAGMTHEELAVFSTRIAIFFP
jgi:SAM-dependent methyltransferase